LAAQDFNDDKKDAGEIGSGHTVTAFYEVVPLGKSLNVAKIDPLKYQPPSPVGGAQTGDLFTVKVRYKDPDGDKSNLLELAFADGTRRFDQTGEDFRFAAAVAAFGMLLRESPHKGSASYELVRELAMAARGRDPEGHRGEFLKLVDTARGLRR
jgi:Ca-activated chloride channel family protein